MKISFLAQLAIGSLMAFSINTTEADIVTIDFTTGTSNGPIAVFDGLPSADREFSSIALSPLIEDVLEIDDDDDDDLGLAVPGLTLSITGGTGFNSDTADAFFNASGSSLGVNSAGTDEAAQFDSGLGESLTIAFNQDVNIISIDLVSFTGTEEFTVGDVTFDASEDVSTVFTFDEGTTFFAAGEGIFLGVGSGVVGIEAITIEVVAVPEPSSVMLIALGAGAFGLVRRRNCR